VGKRASPLDRLLATINRPSHIYRPGTDAFPDIDIGKAARELSIDERAKARVAENALPLGSQLDDVEAEIVEYLEADRKQQYHQLEDALQSYAHRVASLDFHGRVTAIHQTVPDCVTDLQTELASGTDVLSRLRKGLVEHEAELIKFRSDNGLTRPARTSSPAYKFLKWSFLFLILVIECGLNGSFLAKGNSLGWVGGITEALSFAVLNVGAALFAATIGARLLIHRMYGLKLVGFLVLVAWIAFALLLNLALAHYREISTSLVAGGGREVVERMRLAPFDLAELQSWVLFGIGVLFAIAAFADGLLLFDPYWGYGSVDRRVQAASEAYRKRKAWLVGELHAIYQDYSEQIRSLGSDLSARLGEYDRILAGRARLLELFQVYQNQLDTVLRALVKRYRVARGEAGKPVHALSQIKVRVEETGNRADIEKQVAAGHEILRAQAEHLHKEYRAGLASYDQIDTLIGDGRPRNGA